LENLLSLCGDLRAVPAADEISILTRERLSGHKAATHLRQQCLRVLSGFHHADVALFEQYFKIPDYCAICYRALYRRDPGYAARYFPELVSTLRRADRLWTLPTIMRLLVEATFDPPMRHLILEDLITNTDEDSLPDLSAVLRSIGLTIQCASIDNDPGLNGFVIVRTGASGSRELASFSGLNSRRTHVLRTIDPAGGLDYPSLHDLLEGMLDA